MIRIIIVEDQQWMIESLKERFSTQPDFDVIGCGKDACEAINLSEELKPDVAILQMEMPIINGFRLCSSIKIRSQETAVILVGKTFNDQTLFEVVKSGAKGFMLKNSMGGEEINDAVRKVNMLDGYYLDRNVSNYVIPLILKLIEEKNGVKKNIHSTKDPSIAPILYRKIELQIISAVAEGMTNKEIAAKLNVKEGTIRNYVSIILQKMDLKHRTQIAAFAYDNKLA
ncbi:MAG: response regulator transcription factor [Spirochaetaceae bacterium]|jgi:DNA-binding NarL/FixJ family response regulator|nr:response regulator transcription factor [Spirochaetaceae bacterium]